VRIAQVVHNFTGERRGGTERWAEALGRELATRHEVEVFTTQITETIPSPSPANPPIRVEHLEVHGLKATVVHRPRLPTLERRNAAQRAISRAYRRFLADGRFDVVHVHHVMDASVGMLGATASAGVPFVVQLHDWWYVCARIDLIRKDLSICRTGPRMGFACVRHCSPFGDTREYAVAPETRGRHSPADALFVLRYARNRRQLSRVPRFIAGSNFLRDRWAELGLDPSRVKVIPLGLPPVDPPSRRPAARPLRFVTLGRLSLLKGTDVVLEAFRQVAPEDATLTLHGTVPEDQRPVIGPLLEGAGPNVRYAGPYDTDAALAEADVLIAASRQLETFSITAHEAFQRRVPVLAARRGGALAEYVHDGVDGLLFDGPGELRATIDRLVVDPPLVDRLSGRAPRVATVAEQASKVEELYARVP
jgi:glycosyltransferase involved in cell wall biosynthesis